MTFSDIWRKHKILRTLYEYGTPYNYSTAWIPLDNGAALKTVLQTFYQNIAGDNVKEVVVPYVSPLPDVRTTYGGTDLQSENDPAGRSHPEESGTAATNGSDAVFVLSISEVNQYVSSTMRQAYDVSSKTTLRAWWLRSPGETESTSACDVGTTGNVNPHFAATDNRMGYRACLWVKS